MAIEIMKLSGNFKYMHLGKEEEKIYPFIENRKKNEDTSFVKKVDQKYDNKE